MALSMKFCTGFESGRGCKYCSPLKTLCEIEGQLKKVNEEARDEVLEIVRERDEKQRPVYIKRNEIAKNIPDFWLTAFLNHPTLADCLTDEDQKIFKYLDALKVEIFDDVELGYFITFEFKPNPYFENAELTKTFILLDEGGMKITGTNIKWTEGMGYANGVDHGKTGNKRSAPDVSIFSWFEDTRSNICNWMAEEIRNDLWPNPVKYFLKTSTRSSEDADDKGKDDEAEEEE